jgi:2-polyprenyl-3-methyl-5-hydroxy-6-metoxy-1,4-benzoquinol methylase
MSETQQSNCRICLKKFFAYPLGEKDGYKFVGCKACGSVMTDPWVTAQDLEAYYGDIQPEAVHLPNPEKVILSMSNRIKRVAAAVRGFSGKTFVDVTARQGYSVMAAKALGYDARGIDDHDFFVTFAKGKYGDGLFEHATVADYAASGGKADLVFAIEAFCEQTNPEEYLANLAKILNPRGILYIEEPDGNHYNVPRQFSSWPFVAPPANFLYISRKGMEKMLERHGLRIKKSYFTWFPFMKLVVVKK